MNSYFGKTSIDYSHPRTAGICTLRKRHLLECVTYNVNAKYNRRWTNILRRRKLIDFFFDVCYGNAVRTEPVDDLEVWGHGKDTHIPVYNVFLN